MFARVRSFLGSMAGLCSSGCARALLPKVLTCESHSSFPKGVGFGPASQALPANLGLAWVVILDASQKGQQGSSAWVCKARKWWRQHPMDNA
eukprot:4288316-Pleurochrysis_carterae.AAC.2